MDFNNDGRADVISGSYDPGYLFAFLQQADGSYAAGEKINDRNGKPIKVGYAAHVYAADWDNDQDLDLVVGNISGEVYFVRNEGKPGQNAFGAAQPLSAGKERIGVGQGDAGPILVDWDNDGLLDLLVGAGDGSVTFYRNEGAKAEPKLATGHVLIAADESQKDGSRCGMRTKICATDYNGDGLLDLLAGDFAYVQEKQPNLTPEQQADADKAQEEYQAVVKEYMAAYEKSGLMKLAQQYQQMLEGPAGETAEQAKAREAQAEELRKQIETRSQKEFQSFIDRMTELRTRMPGQNGSYHGFVWLYLRQAEK